MSSNILGLNGVTKSHDGRRLISDVSLGLDVGEKVGLIGANGAGKSTLLRIIAGQTSPDAGRVSLRKGTRVAFLEQVPNLAGYTTVRQALDDSLAELRQCIAAYERAAAKMDPDGPELLDRIERLGGWDYQHRVENAAAQAKIAELEAPIEHLSGGERKRVALARLILQQPDLLLIDEPTNHLDATTVAWLEEWLKGSRATVILVTHDRYFLDDVVDRLLELRDGSLRAYAGNYTDYLGARAVEEAHQARTRHRQLRILMGELEWARRSPKARTTKSRARLDRIDQAQQEVLQLAGAKFAVDFAFGRAPRLGRAIVELDSLNMAFGDGPPLLSGLTLTMRRGERIGILGPNSAGKSTLLKLIVGELEPTGGKVKIGVNTRIAYFDQQRAALDNQATVRETLTAGGADVVTPGHGPTIHVAAWLDRFGFDPLTHDRPVATLSGGERNRLAIARFLLEDANLLIMDEPTNDLDIPTLNLLEQSLAEFDGCVLVVSHDRYFLDKVVTGILAFESDYLGPAAVNLVQGGYTHYRDLRLRQLEDERQQKDREQAAVDRQAKAKARAKVKAKPGANKGLTYGERLELEGLEPAVEEADGAVAALEEQLADPLIWRDGAEKGREIQEKLGAAQERAATLLCRWEELMTKLEGL